MNEPTVHPSSRHPSSRDLLALTLIPGLGPVRIDRLIQAAGSPSRVLTMTLSQLKSVPGIGPRTASDIITGRAKVDELVEQELKRTNEAGVCIVTIFDDHYPPLLKGTPGAPPVLQYRGTLNPASNQHAIGMVGSRKSTIYGLEQATRFSMALASAGFTVISGGARGIDSASHKGALDAGGQTQVVLGCGLGHIYPKENAPLFDRVVEQGGAVISELPFSAPPASENFPARNRIISGLSLGVLVLEAGRRSGALITARHAVEDHGREVFAIPGRIDSSASAGSNDLLKSGAHLVTEPGEIIEILERNSVPRSQGTPTSAREQSSEPAILKPIEPEQLGNLDPVSVKILEALSEPRTGDQLAEQLGMDPGGLRAAATMLEIQGRIRRSGVYFQRTR